MGSTESLVLHLHILASLVGIHVEFTKLFSLLLLSETKVISSLIQKSDDLLLETSFFQLLKQNLLVIFLDLVLKFADFKLVFSIASDKWRTFIEFSLDLGWGTLLSCIEIAQIFVQLLIDLTRCILLGHVVRFIYSGSCF